MEHLVPDPDGPIGLDDLSSDVRDEMSREWTPESGLAASDGEPRFAIRMVSYGTDECTLGESEGNVPSLDEHKANRARFEEQLFKKGYLGLEG